MRTVSKMVLNDWQRGRIPFFVKPPNMEQEPQVRPARTLPFRTSKKQFLFRKEVSRCRTFCLNWRQHLLGGIAVTEDTGRDLALPLRSQGRGPGPGVWRLLLCLI